VHARLLDVLHHRGDVAERAVRERVDVELDRVLEESVDQHAPVEPHHRVAHLLGRVADPHRAAAQHVRRPHEHRVADPLRDGLCLLRALGGAPGRHADPELVRQPAEALTVLGEVDRPEGRAEDRDPGLLERGRELERRLAAELDHDPLRPLALEHREH
jgi:hypothetical protein